MGFSFSSNLHVQNIGTKNIFAKKVFRKFLYWNREKVKKSSALGQKELPYKFKKNMHSNFLGMKSRPFHEQNTACTVISTRE